MLEEQIQEMVDRETRAWDAQTLVSIFRPDMLWPWLPTSQTHDPVEWVFSQGRFDRKRGKEGWQERTYNPSRGVCRAGAPGPEIARAIRGLKS